MRAPILVTALLALALAALAEDSGWQCPQDMFAVLPPANYSGQLPCSLPGTQQGSASACEELEGKVALITGASTGIGRGLADRLVAAGMTVVGTSRTPQKYLSGGNCTYTMPGDVCAPDGFELWELDQASDQSVAQLLQRVNDTYGALDLLVLNAGRNFYGDMLNSDLRAIQQSFDTNFFGPLRVLRAALPLMPASGYSRVLVTASVQSFFANGWNLPYPVSKAGLSMLQETLLKELMSHPANIQIINVHPGIVYTDIKAKAIVGCPELAARVLEPRTPTTTPGGLTAAEAGEAFYQIALMPKPSLRYILANMTGDLPGQHDTICRHWTSDVEQWISSFEPLKKTWQCPPRGVAPTA